MVRGPVHRCRSFTQNAAERPFSMPLYPLPVILALAGWIFIFVMSGWQYMLSAVALVVIGIVAFRLFTQKSNVVPAKH